jgi:hypothetical protein
MDWDSIDDMMFDGSGYLRPRGPRGPKPTNRNNDPKDFAHKCIGDNRTSPLPSCHYTDDRFLNAQTIFGRRKKRGGYDYSDRYSMWDSQRGTNRWSEGHDLARAESEKDDCNWSAGSVAYYEMVLSHFHQKKTHIDHVLTGFNWSSGYSYLVFGYYHPRTKKS